MILCINIHTYKKEILQFNFLCKLYNNHFMKGEKYQLYLCINLCTNNDKENFFGHTVL